MFIVLTGLQVCNAEWLLRVLHLRHIRTLKRMAWHVSLGNQDCFQAFSKVVIIIIIL